MSKSPKKKERKVKAWAVMEKSPIMFSYTEKAIVKAIEGGWLPSYTKLEHTFTNKQMGYGPAFTEQDCTLSLNSIFNNPLFWQSLSKKLGWKSIVPYHLHLGNGKYTLYYVDKEYETYEVYTLPRWAFEMHSFIDHLIAGKDAESFFVNLLKK